MIVWLASYPRSGNTFARLLFKQYFGIYVYSRYDDTRLTHLLGQPPQSVSLEEMAASGEIFFVKTHDLPADDFPAIYLVRDGRDALVSYVHYILSYERTADQLATPEAFDDTLCSLVKHNASFGGWGRNVLAWTRRSARTAVLKFEQLVAAQDPLPILTGALKSIGQTIPDPVSSAALPSFSELRELSPGFFRKGRIGAWRDEMPAEILELFWDLHGPAMEAVGYATGEQLAFYRTRVRKDRDDIRDLEARLLDKQKIIELEESLRGRLTDENRLLQARLAELEAAAARLRAELRAKLRALEESLEAQKVQAETDAGVMRDQTAALQAKELVIQKFKSSYLFWIVNGPFRWFPGLPAGAGGVKRFLHIFTPKLGVLAQHPPRPLTTPRRYQMDAAHTSDPSPPTISIVTPSYNQGEFVERTVRSILGQEYSCLEYVVQDGGSQDGTLQALAGYRQQLTAVESRPDRGQAHALNLGFARTRGEIMAYINSDDVLLPGALHFLADYFRAHPEVDVVYSHRVIIDEQDREIGRWVLPPHDDRVLSWADYVPQETMFWRRRIWDRAGSEMNENYQYVLDWDLLLRFRAAGARFARLPRFLAAFRLHTRSKTSLELERAALIEMNRLRAQIHGREVSWPEIRREIAPYLRRSLLYHISYRLRNLRE